MRTWYNLKADDDSAVISIFDAIGEFGVSAKNFLNDFRGIKANDVTVEINSPGGDVFAGIAIYNGLRASGKKITVKIMGVAASAASLIAMAGDTIHMPANTFMMVHNPWTFAAGDAEDLRDSADMLDKIGASLVGTYASRTGKPAPEVKALLDAETWFTAEEALAAGFATHVTDAIQAQAKFDPDRVPDKVKALFCPPAAHQKPAPAPTPMAPTHAEQVAAIAAQAGMDEFAAVWALDATLGDPASVMARAIQAREVKALCVLAGQAQSASAFIREAKPLPEVRAALLQKLDDDDAATQVDTATKIKNGPPEGTAPTAVNTSDYWAMYHNIPKGTRK